MALIQKMDHNKGFFGSATYQVPLENLYVCSIKNERLQLSDVSDDSGSDDALSVSDLPDKEVISSSDDSDFEITVPEIGNDHEEVSSAPTADSSVINRRSSRSRRQPDRYGSSTSYNSDTPFSGENDVVQNYWPNYPRGTWSPDNVIE